MQEVVFEPVDSVSILVVGDIILDQYIYGETNRISPEAPVPVVRVNETEERPGGAANVAVNISALGIAVQLLGVTGKDEASQRLEKILNDKGVTCHFDRQEGFPTITKRRVISQHQQLIRLDYENEIQKMNTEVLVDKYVSLLESVDVVVLSDYAKGSLGQIETLINKAKQNNIPVLVDPKSTDFSRYRHATMLTPNQKEFEVIVGKCASNDELIEKGEALCQQLALRSLLVTRGEKGMTLLRTDGPSLHFKAESHEVYDVTGAGDTVISVLAAAIACDYKIEQATALANTAAGLVIEKLGAATVTVDEINCAKNNQHQKPVIVNEQTVMELIKLARRNGEQIVMTNGCFDILHAGHIDYLSEAKSLGDLLVVAVNDDASVKRLKGESRPINALQNRMAVLSALTSVDLVIPFSEDTPEKLISLFQPDILVKGGDYTESEVVGAELVKEYGGDVRVVSFAESCSTSQILEKIKQQ